MWYVPGVYPLGRKPEDCDVYGLNMGVSYGDAEAMRDIYRWEGKWTRTQWSEVGRNDKCFGKGTAWFERR